MRRCDYGESSQEKDVSAYTAAVKYKLLNPCTQTGQKNSNAVVLFSPQSGNTQPTVGTLDCG